MKTRKLILASLLSVFSFSALAQNGAPGGAHFNLNIIGTKSKTGDFSGSNGRVIFMPLTGNSKILLQEGADFKVLDANGTDGSAKFQLPNPDPDNSGITTYSVFARALGKPGGSSKMVPCATEIINGEELCSTQSLVSVRSSGKQSFSNVSQQLLYVYVDVDADGDIDRVPLFDDRMKDYFWSYDNAGLKILQLRFYPTSTNVN